MSHTRTHTYRYQSLWYMHCIITRKNILKNNSRRLIKCLRNLITIHFKITSLIRIMFFLWKIIHSMVLTQWVVKPIRSWNLATINELATFSTHVLAICKPLPIGLLPVSLRNNTLQITPNKAIYNGSWDSLCSFVCRPFATW